MKMDSYTIRLHIPWNSKASTDREREMDDEAITFPLLQGLAKDSVSNWALIADVQHAWLACDVTWVQVSRKKELSLGIWLERNGRNEDIFGLLKWKGSKYKEKFLGGQIFFLGDKFINLHIFKVNFKTFGPPTIHIVPPLAIGILCNVPILVFYAFFGSLLGLMLNDFENNLSQFLVFWVYFTIFLGHSLLKIYWFHITFSFWPKCYMRITNVNITYI